MKKKIRRQKVNLTIDGTIYPSQHFPFGAAFVCQAGNFWNLLRTYIAQKQTALQQYRGSVAGA